MSAARRADVPLNLAKRAKKANRAVASALAEHLEPLIRRGTDADVTRAINKIAYYAMHVIGDRVAQLDGIAPADDERDAVTKKAARTRDDGYRVGKARLVPCSLCGEAMRLDARMTCVRTCQGVAIPTVTCSSCSLASIERSYRRRLKVTTVDGVVSARRAALRGAAKERRLFAAHLHDRILPLVRALVANVREARPNFVENASASAESRR